MNGATITGVLAMLMTLATLATGCAARQPFTRATMSELGITKETARGYQFYVAHDLKMGATDTRFETEVQAGKVVSRGEIHKDIVVVPRDTEVTIDRVDDHLLVMTAGQGSQFVFSPVTAGSRMTVVEEERGLVAWIASLFGNDVNTLTAAQEVPPGHDGWYCLLTSVDIPYEGKSYRPQGSTCLQYERNTKLVRSERRRTLGGSTAK